MRAHLQIMKLIGLLLLTMLLAGAASPSKLDSYIDAAEGAPAEFAADALIRIASLDQVPKARKIQLLDDAFNRAAGAQQPYKRQTAFLHGAGPGGFLNRAYDQDLDALSLRLRAVEAMLPLDPFRARTLFLQIPPIDAPKLTCADFMVYDFSRYYAVLESVAAKTFTPKEIQSEEPFALIKSSTAGITSAVQVAPVARLLAGAKLTNDQFRTLVAQFAASLEKISGDDRSFEFSRGVGTAIQSLAAKSKQNGVSPLPLLEAYRLYLVNNLSGARCADDDQMQQGHAFAFTTGLPADSEAANTIQFFNDKLRVDPLQAVEEQEVTPASIDGNAKGLNSCDSPECKTVAAQYRGMIFGSNGIPYTNAQKSTTEWQSQLQDFISALADWKEPSGDETANYFRDKCGLYSDVFNVVPPGPDRELVLRAMLDFLKQNRYQTENRMEWFLPVNTLIGRIGLDPLGLGNLAGDVKSVNDPLIALYANLESLVPRSPAQIMPLL
ncbi:MAG TPA: hypothetical protein VG675_23780 [Bryobacteraceae bacterium]|nr:hypothetical protein [Bryobacteraceae bacterium]